MSAVNVTIEAEFENGRTLEELERLIAMRQRVLGQTTGEAVIATAINILSSVRGLTKVVDPKKASGFVTVKKSPYYEPCWVTEGGGHKRLKRGGYKEFVPRHRGVRRIGSIHHDASVKFVNLAGAYRRGENPQCFLAIDRRGDGLGAVKEEQFLIIAHDELTATNYVKIRREKRIRKLAGMAKWVIGQAQSQIAAGKINDAVGPIAQRIGLAALEVSANVTGLSEGSASVTFADNLNYAALALQNGMSDFENSMKRAANRTAGIIQKFFIDHNIDERVESPFPEAKRRR